MQTRTPRKPIRRHTARKTSMVRRNTTGVEILNRVVQPTGTNFSPEAARTLLALRFHKLDERRMDQLAAKARKGTLTDRERSDAEQYNLVNHLLALLQATARQALQQSGEGSETA